MKPITNIYDLLDPADAAEHQRLTKLLKKAESPAPLTIAEIAELCGCSETTIFAAQQDALTKLRHQFPELKKELKSN